MNPSKDELYGVAQEARARLRHKDHIDCYRASLSIFKQLLNKYPSISLEDVDIQQYKITENYHTIPHFNVKLQQPQTSEPLIIDGSLEQFNPNTGPPVSFTEETDSLPPIEICTESESTVPSEYAIQSPLKKHPLIHDTSFTLTLNNPRKNDNAPNRETEAVVYNKHTVSRRETQHRHQFDDIRSHRKTPTRSYTLLKIQTKERASHRLLKPNTETAYINLFQPYDNQDDIYALVEKPGKNTGYTKHKIRQMTITEYDKDFIWYSQNPPVYAKRPQTAPAQR